MKLQYQMTCLCGANCQPGTDVRMEREPCDDEGQPVRWYVRRCPACDVSLSNVADVGVDRLDPGISLAERMRRNRIRDERKRGKCNGND